MNTNKEKHGLANTACKLSFVVCVLLSAGAATNSYADTVSLTWNANSETDIAGYKVYYKANSAEPPFDGAGAIQGVAPIDVQNQTTATISGLDPGSDYYFAVTAYNTAGLESSYSQVIGFPGVKDTTAPSVSFTSPGNGAVVGGNVSLTASATDDIGVTRVEYYQNGSLLTAGNVPPYSFNWATAAMANGLYTLQAKAYDAAGNVGTSSISVNVLNDSVPPTLTLGMSATASAVTVPVLISATDNIGVTGYILSESSATPTAADPRWSTAVPTSITFSSEGLRTAYAWAKDAAGNVSATSAASVTISLPDTTAPSVTSFSMPVVSTSTTVTVSSFSATDNNSVTGYIITESASAPTATGSGWSSSTPTRFTFAGTGTRTAYAWAKDAAGNVSAASAATVTIDNIAPVISAPSLAINGPSLMISASATDNFAVTKMQVYVDNALQLESYSNSISCLDKVGKGSHTVTVMAYDAAGNISTRSANIIR